MNTISRCLSEYKIETGRSTLAKIQEIRRRRRRRSKEITSAPKKLFRGWLYFIRRPSGPRFAVRRPRCRRSKQARMAKNVYTQRRYSRPVSLSLSIVRKRSTSRCTHSMLCTRCCCSGRWWWCWPRRRWPMRCCCWCCCCRQRRWFMTERKRNKSCLELRKYNNSDDDNKNNSKDNNNFEMDACCNVWRKMKLYRKR